MVAVDWPHLVPSIAAVVAASVALGFLLPRLLPAPWPVAHAVGVACWTLYVGWIRTLPDDLKHGDAHLFALWVAAAGSWSAASEAGRLARRRAFRADSARRA